MTASFLTPVLLDSRRGLWRVRFDSTLSAPAYRLYDLTSGALLYQGTVPYFDLIADAPPVLWLTDDSGESPPELISNRLTLQWTATGDAVAYRIERLAGDGVTWQTEARLAADGRWIVTWQGGPYADAESVTLRVVAVGADGTDSTPATVATVMAVTPSVPPVTYTLEVTGEEGSETAAIVISEAADA